MTKATKTCQKCLGDMRKISNSDKMPLYRCDQCSREVVLNARPTRHARKRTSVYLTGGHDDFEFIQTRIGCGCFAAGLNKMIARFREEMNMI
jgi:DNA-directed RNA polymerase subunit RPC12/RpoP